MGVSFAISKGSPSALKRVGPKTIATFCECILLTEPFSITLNNAQQGESEKDREELERMCCVCKSEGEGRERGRGGRRGVCVCVCVFKRGGGGGVEGRSKRRKEESITHFLKCFIKVTRVW